MSRQRCHRFVAISASCKREGFALAQLRRVAPLALAGTALVMAGCTSLPWSHDADKASRGHPIPLKIPAPVSDPRPVVSKAPATPAPPAPSAEDLGRAPAIKLPGAFLPPVSAREYQVWRCTPAQDLLMAFGQSAAGATSGHHDQPQKDRLHLWSRDHAYTLEHVISASGARYQAEGTAPMSEGKIEHRAEKEAEKEADKDSGQEGMKKKAKQKEVESGGEKGLEVWFKGTQATLRNARGRLECEQDDRRQIRPIASEPLLVAQGNEPGWQVSLDKTRNLLTLTASAGLLASAHGDSLVARSADSPEELLIARSDVLADESIVAAMPAVIASTATVLTLPYRVAKDDAGERVLKASLPKGASGVEHLQFSVTPGACFDSMQGAPYPLTASLTLDGRTLGGCGEAFRY